jgi:hypothetical protein
MNELSSKVDNAVYEFNRRKYHWFLPSILFFRRDWYCQPSSRVCNSFHIFLLTWKCSQILSFFGHVIRRISWCFLS